MRFPDVFPTLAAGLVIFGSNVFAVEKPNIVFFLADDLGWTGLSCFGSDLYETPNIDEMAENGMKFTHAYAACTVCSPTRASIMTGQYPARLHLTDFIAGQNRPFAKRLIPDWTKGLKHELTTLPEALKRVGYRTGIVGKWHLERRGHVEEDAPSKHGFDVEYKRPAGTKGFFLSKAMAQKTERRYLTDYWTDRALDFIGESKGEEPFFLFMGYNTPHTPIQGKPELVEKFAKKVKEGGVHTNPTYAAMVASLDESVGRILKKLKSAGKEEDTIVIFTSDNGGLTQRYGKHDGFTENLPLRRGKGSAYEGGVRVPAIVRWPGHVREGVECATPIVTADYFPTFLELAGAKPGPKQPVDGKSILPLFGNPTRQLDRDLFWHYPHYHAGGDGPYSAVRSGDWRLVEFHGNEQVELYNLASDPGERANVASEQAAVVSDLQGKLVKWRASVRAQPTRKNPDYDPARATLVRKPRKKTSR